MAVDSNTIESLNALATRLRDYCDDVRHPTLAKDLDTAADVASDMARWRFVVAEVANGLPVENPSKKELLALLGKAEG
jgi:Ser/Thr protein kinase RdoA (MazF antagonist)